MYGQAEGFIAPCLYGIKGKEAAYLLFNEEAEDVLINAKYISNDLVMRGGKLRFFGTITARNGFKEMSVERFIEL